MDSIGALIAGATAEAPASAPAREERPRVHRVTLCVMTFAEIDVTATNATEAIRLAEQSVAAAKRTFRTKPAAHRVRVEEKVDFRRPELGTRWKDVTP